LEATVITNSPPIAIALAEHDRIETILLGGRLYKKAMVNVGTTAIESLRSIRADICMLGVCSLHPEVGISVANLDEAHVKKAMIAGAAEVIGLATEAKLDTASNYVVDTIQALTYLVTAPTVDRFRLANYAALGITIIQEN
jgi:DeoR/GlpR family transcriptional regulator of sugar metabolism